VAGGQATSSPSRDLPASAWVALELQPAVARRALLRARAAGALVSGGGADAWADGGGELAGGVSAGRSLAAFDPPFLAISDPLVGEELRPTM